MLATGVRAGLVGGAVWVACKGLRAAGVSRLDDTVAVWRAAVAVAVAGYLAADFAATRVGKVSSGDDDDEWEDADSDEEDGDDDDDDGALNLSCVLSQSCMHPILHHKRLNFQQQSSAPLTHLHGRRHVPSHQCGHAHESVVKGGPIITHL